MIAVIDAMRKNNFTFTNEKRRSKISHFNFSVAVFLFALSVSLTSISPTLASTADERAFDEALNLCHLGHYGEGKRILREVQRRHPNDVYVLTELGNAYMNDYNDVAGGVDKAEKCLRRAIEIDPEYGKAYSILAECSDAKGDFAQGVKLATKALSVKRPCFDALHERACAYSRLKKDKEALADIELFLKKSVKVERKYLLRRASILENLKEYDRAIAEYRKLLKEKYEDQIVYREAACLQAMHKPDEAIKSLTTLVNHNKADDSGYLNRARLYESMGKHKEAVDDYTKALDLQPSTNALRERATVYEKMGRKDLAEKDRKEIERF